MFSGLISNLVPTLINGVARAFKINLSEETPDTNINDQAAKAIKIVTRLVVIIVLYKLFPSVWKELFTLVFQTG